MRRMIVWLSGIVAVALYIVPVSWAWEGITHAALTERAVLTVQDVLNPALQAQLGFQDGIDHKLGAGEHKHSILEWMQDGAIAEDEPFFRVFNHFHNPFEPALSTSILLDEQLNRRHMTVMFVSGSCRQFLCETASRLGAAISAHMLKGLPLRTTGSGRSERCLLHTTASWTLCNLVGNRAG